MSVATPREPPDFAAYERAAARWMRTHGFPDAHVTMPGIDAGLDVIAKGAAAQVKAWSKPVGRPELQRLKGAALYGDKLFFFSRGGFTSAAREYASRPDVRMELITLPEASAKRAQMAPASGLHLSFFVMMAVALLAAWLLVQCVFDGADSSKHPRDRSAGATITLAVPSTSSSA
jgi:hypothetical protein